MANVPLFIEVVMPHLEDNLQIAKSHSDRPHPPTLGPKALTTTIMAQERFEVHVKDEMEAVGSPYLSLPPGSIQGVKGISLLRRHGATTNRLRHRPMTHHGDGSFTVNCIPASPTRQETR